MQEKLEKEFRRYFFLSPQTGGQSFGFGRLFGGGNRNELSEIIPQRVYLSNLRRHPFSQDMKIAETKDSALVVSCNDINELAGSGLLLEPGSKNIKYHVIAMQDATARTGNLEQICDALRLMASFAAQNKPIHIHCLNGVGRSAMITAAHLAHCYLLGDPVIVKCIDDMARRGTKFNPEQPNFIPLLYKVSCRFVFTKRNCCQFDSKDREDIAIHALTKLYDEIKGVQLIAPQDDNYAFINELVQSASFKKIHHEYYHLLDELYGSATQSSDPAPSDRIDLKEAIKQFFTTFIRNKEGWYQQLVQAVNVDEEFPNNPLNQFCRSLPQGDKQEQELSLEKRKELLMGLIETMNHLCLKYPTAQYSQHVSRAQELIQSSSCVL